MIWFCIAGVCILVIILGCIFFKATEAYSGWEDVCGTMMIAGFVGTIVFGLAGIIAVTDQSNPGHTKEALTQFSQLYPAAVNPVLAYDNISYKDYTSGTAQLCTITFNWDEAHKVAVWAEPACGKIVG